MARTIMNVGLITQGVAFLASIDLTEELGRARCPTRGRVHEPVNGSGVAAGVPFAGQRDLLGRSGVHVAALAISMMATSVGRAARAATRSARRGRRSVVASLPNLGAGERGRRCRSVMGGLAVRRVRRSGELAQALAPNGPGTGTGRTARKGASSTVAGDDIDIEEPAGALIVSRLTVPSAHVRVKYIHICRGCHEPGGCRSSTPAGCPAAGAWGPTEGPKPGQWRVPTRVAIC